MPSQMLVQLHLVLPTKASTSSSPTKRFFCVWLDHALDCWLCPAHGGMRRRTRRSKREPAAPESSERSQSYLLSRKSHLPRNGTKILPNSKNRLDALRPLSITARRPQDQRSNIQCHQWRRLTRREDEARRQKARAQKRDLEVKARGSNKDWSEPRQHEQMRHSFVN